MQYWKPDGAFFVGDCIPFWHEGVFHLFYLLDEMHHQALGGMGGHKWAQMTTRDLVHWEHQPLALPIDQPFERAICTGSLFYQGGQYHIFYATRMPDWQQKLSRAVSDDCIHFTKLQPNPFAEPPPGYSPLHFRDPVVFADEENGGYHMIVTSMLEEWPLPGYGGCLAHLTSPDLQSWQMQEPLLVPGFDDAPECPDYFVWNGWHYLLFSNHLATHYRMARHPMGPWLRPAVDSFDGALARVMKTAAFGDDRRIGAAWLGTRSGDLDEGKPQWGGNLLLREIVQLADGTLGAKFPVELTPACAPPLPLVLQPLTAHAVQQETSLHLQAQEGLEAALIGGLPQDLRIRFDVTPSPAPVSASVPAPIFSRGSFGLRLRSESFTTGCVLTFYLAEERVTLQHEAIGAVSGLDQPFGVEIVTYGDIIDVCIDNRRCIVNRCPQQQGAQLFFFAHNADVTLHNIQIEPLLA